MDKHIDVDTGIVSVSSRVGGVVFSLGNSAKASYSASKIDKNTMMKIKKIICLDNRGPCA